MPDAYEAHQPYIGEIMDLIKQHLRRHPNPNIFYEAWRVGLVTVLTEIARVGGMLPADIETFLTRFCTDVTADTKRNIHDWDTRGPQWR
jgi:hypothetical protein